MGLANIDDGPAFQVMQSDLGGSVACQQFRGCHRPPPIRGVRRDRRDAGATGSVESAGWLAAGASTLASEVLPGTTAWASWAGGGLAGRGRVMASVFLRDGETLLTPACQLQENRSGYYRPS